MPSYEELRELSYADFRQVAYEALAREPLDTQFLKTLADAAIEKCIGGGNGPKYNELFIILDVAVLDAENTIT
jgi:hypothetical protein